jgi:hypothetical protein
LAGQGRTWRSGLAWLDGPPMHFQTPCIRTNKLLNFSALSVKPWVHGFFDTANQYTIRGVVTPENNGVVYLKFH